MDGLHEFTAWLGNTPASVAIQSAFWVIPTVQSVHIAAIAVVMAGMAMLDLRLLGIAAMRQPVAALVQRFWPWTKGALVVLLLSGLILIVGEPARELQSPMFQAKMVLLVVAVGLTMIIQNRVRSDGLFWETHRAMAAAVAVVSLGLWLAVLTAGRWIAYSGQS